ncbi:P-loop containing nucleoside triphosphate hydrolase protein [Polyplosphaeria fusca]|uniref:P-loop containing nucleoside triphosphate hydrolase protein n=1 Tax=Polyplosphaeria fusca TaxID=682080 RepID=A0A9P4R2W1_9PLEO|nr:P-loop containing nucleoside triphosphate hydrolase protein [Polyplosphaeria fusca]
MDCMRTLQIFDTISNIGAVIVIHHTDCGGLRITDDDVHQPFGRSIFTKSSSGKQQAYARQLVEVQEEIDHQERILREKTDEQDRKHALEQKRLDLANLKSRVHQTTTKYQPSTLPASDKLSQSASSTNDPQNPTTNHGQSLPEWENSESKDDWEWEKKNYGAKNAALDSLMGMIGLESVKQQFLTIKGKIDTIVRQNLSLKGERFGAVLLGNPGTGKTTVARIYAQFLVEVGALPGNHFLETSGSALANDGVNACKAHIDKILEEGGGVFFIDEAYQLVSGNSFGGKAVLDYLLAEMENLTGKVVFVLAGYHKQMEAFFQHNPGLPSRIPKQLEFQDYSNKELHSIMCYSIKAKYKDHMKVDDGLSGLYMRINRLSQITERHSNRLRKERWQGLKPDDNLLTREDLIGLEPSSTLKNNVAWSRLQKLIGLQSDKNSAQILLDTLQANYQRELQEMPLIDYSLNKCFIESPGTRKTSVAKLYGRILADIGLLSNGEVVVKNPADFVGSVLGQSEANTKAILASTMGKVLIIDESYMLAGGASADPYKIAVIDTIVAEVQSTPGEDRCVLLLGYKDQMEEMFCDVNPGLARRFPLESSFVFEDFADPELQQILNLKLKDAGFQATDQAKQVAMDVLRRARNRPNFGNAGEHMSNGSSKSMDTFDAIDFDPEFDRGERAVTNLPQLFKDAVGCDQMIKQFQGYQTTAANMKALGMNPREQILFNFLFKGPPGTGKTKTAQKMGKVYYDMGFLAQAKVIECSATDLIGQYVGQTGPKVQKLFEKALGKILFIDEAYRLAEGGFATEAMDELVDCLTKPKFAQNLVTILAGYDEDMNRLMNINPGLTSRFPESVIFPPMDAQFCLELLTKVLDGFRRKANAPLDLSILDPPSLELKNKLLELFESLTQLKSWGNARDVKTLAKTMFGKLISTLVQPNTQLLVTEIFVIEALQNIPPGIPQDGRDPGVSDEVWNQLHSDKQAAVEREKEHRRLQEEKLREEQRIADLERAAKAAADEAEKQRLIEEMRQAEIERRRQKAILEAIEREREKEREAQKKIQMMGPCPMDFAWIKQTGGYRCAGGSHWMSDARLGL